MRRTSLAVMAILVASLVIAEGGGFVSLTALAEPVVVLDMDDPVGDDHGPGTYGYPTHKAFVPGLFDLTHFKVSHDPEYVYFDATFKEITNPWNAPEGFSHQLINIYIDTTPGAGRTDTLRKGALVAFDRRYGWDLFIKAVGWGGCRVFTAKDESEARGIADGLSASVLADGKTVRVAVPKAVIGEPSRRWGYYVLVGSQDAFGEDDFRPVMEKAGPWVFGGGSDLEVDPNVIDMLAPARGRASQERMLGSYNLERGSLAVLVPVFATAGGNGAVSRGAVAAVVVTLVAAGAVGWWARRRRPTTPPRR
ncbi:MAG: glucodextranase DOMON-like domain-containing protein [Clostridia bacterium]